MAKSLLFSDFSQSMLPVSVAAGAQVSSADGTRELTVEELAAVSGGFFLPAPSPYPGGGPGAAAAWVAHGVQAAAAWVAHEVQVGAQWVENEAKDVWNRAKKVWNAI